MTTPWLTPGGEGDGGMETRRKPRGSAIRSRATSTGRLWPSPAGAEDTIANDLIRRQRDIPLVLPHGGPGIRRLMGSGF